MVGTGRVCVVIPAYRAAETIGAVIRSLPVDVESIIVVDDGSPDGTAEAASAVGDGRVTVVRQAANQGVGETLLNANDERA
jgi:rhamnosyltransferase